MAFGDLLKNHLQTNDLFKKYISLATFFVTECGWTQQQFDEAEVEFMNDVLEEYIRIHPKKK